MSVYFTGALSEGMLRRPLRYIRRIRASAAAAQPTPQQTRRQREQEAANRAARRPYPHNNTSDNVNPIAVTHTRAVTTIPGRHARQAVLGVAVLTAADITAEERADVSTYFEAVGPDGRPLMEELAPPPSRGGCNAVENNQLMHDGRHTAAGAAGGGAAAAEHGQTEVSSGLTLRERSNHHCGNGGDGARESGEDSALMMAGGAEKDTQLPAFVSFGAAAVARPRIRAPRAESKDLHSAPVSPSKPGRKSETDTATRQASAVTETTSPRRPLVATTTITTVAGAAVAPNGPLTENPSSPTTTAAAATATTTPTAQRSRPRASRHTAASPKAPKPRRDEATIVFSDPCVVALEGTAVTAFAAAYQVQSVGLHVDAVLPQPRVRRSLNNNNNNTVSRLGDAQSPRRGNVMDAFEEHALSVMHSVRGATRRRRSQAVVLSADATDSHVQECAQEAKFCQRPRFRRRSSVEVYGRSAYATA